tara:strand:+ start:383 stop:1036 length:654 start_codon:yes stop_codon:yes gene_type:complete
MKSVSINGIARVNLGKSFAKKLREEDNVPCVLYGGKEEPVHFYAHTNEFRKIIYTPEVFLIDLIVGDETIRAMMGDIQFHPVTDKILHIDFLRIFDNAKVQINLPVIITGNSIGVRNGGRLVLNMRKLLVEAFANDLPENIEIDISLLRIGNSIRISDLSPENLTFLNNSDDVVVAVKTARAAILEEEEETTGDVTAEGETAEGETTGDATTTGSSS